MELTQLLQKLASVKVLVIGDIMLDHYVWGDVQRISPEAPVPVVHVNKDTYTAGGAANVALNLANLGVETTIIGYCANDEAGARLTEIFAENKISQVFPISDNTVPTIIKTRVVVRGQQLCRIDREASRDLYNMEAKEGFEELFEPAVANADAIIISDYAKGLVTQKLLNRLVKNPRHKEGSMIIAHDPKPSSRLDLSGIGLLTPNRNEALELAGISDHPDNYPLDDICRSIHEKYNPRLLVITLGAEGMAISKNGKVIKKMPTEARQVFDVSGAGDTVIAILTASLASGANPFEAATLANISAGCVVSHFGTAPITLDELKASVNDYKKKFEN